MLMYLFMWCQFISKRTTRHVSVITVLEIFGQFCWCYVFLVPV
jgi:hypothetical protein